MLPVKGKTMIENICAKLQNSFSEILISADNIQKYSFLGLKVVPDKISNQGPLMAIASAMDASTNDFNFVVACDMPHIPMPLVHRMLAEAENADIVVPDAGNQKYEPLFAVYRKSALSAVNKVLSGPSRKISDVFNFCKVDYIKIKKNTFFTNLNTKVDYEEFQNKHED